MQEALAKQLRDGLDNSPLAELVEIEVGGNRTSLTAIFIEPLAPFGNLPATQRLSPMMDFNDAELSDTRAKAGDVIIRRATLFDPGTRYVIVDIPPPDVAGRTRVAVRLQL